jgi:tRNA-2-methylthio-N6-dimethylallyladenosine synthase
VLFAQQRQFNNDQIGVTLPVLVCGKGRKPGQLFARSPYLQAVHFTHESARQGDILELRITAASHNALTGIVPMSEVA